MTNVTDVPPIVLAGTTDTGRRYVQYWTEHDKIAGQDVTRELAEMNDGSEFAPNRLAIRFGCPDEWIPQILTAFDVFRSGGEVTPTHTVYWEFSRATFTPIPAVTNGDNQ